MLYAVFVGVGLLAGALSGALGIGGGIVIVPLLILLLGYDQHTAQGHSLGMLVLPVVLAGFLQYWNNPAVRPHLSLIGIACMAAAFMVGGWLGGRWANGIDAALLRKVFAVVLVANGLWLFVKR